MSPARRAAFLRALAETGNQTLAAERAKVSRSWVQLRRSTDAEFDAAVREACLDFARHERDGTKPPRGWGSLDGEELVVRGTNGARVQIARARLKQWTPRIEARFLQTLSATCNVRASCAEVGMSPASAYLHRKRWPRFAAMWDEALATGYARIEIALVENGCNLFSPGECPPEAPIPPMTVEQAIHILHMHKHRLHGIGRTPGRWLRPRTLDEVRESILRKLEAIDNARGIAAGERAADERDYAARRWRLEE